ncbi:FAD dependent oxidoreductase [Colletotrichum higginsianum]|uniref:FAD dependent oxidoreductase n=2 Tax=Colletotrichum higginsianum TaxID=80884 RepID=H1VN17_COLHI|nr:FAD dependent oxidoreductase [Colletotrichum higginsianum IMI 349063]OBR04798.1 FAD dependent oxidoreductase [Colletotrichum higginsianum IMI 349063]TIC93576.1 Beta-cyclopiazonate dehydrogenase [Colletotrichum higginsianum]CCF41621.1 FAD dependent oxidoreductase [Colletotrichum higginsianum]
MRSNGMRAGVGFAAALLVRGAAASVSCCNQTVSRDVVVVGGGAAGAHAAVWLRDHGHSVVVVEKASQLGGHTASYHDPVSGKSINVGVQAWMEYKDTFDFPKRMSVSTSGAMQFTTLDYNYVDFKTGQPVDGWVAPTPDAMYPALQRYLDVLEKYEDITLPGFDNFPEPGSIPEDLAMPFGEFVEKYDIAAAVPQIWDSTAMGLGNTMDVPTFFVTQASGVPMVRALLGTAAAATPASGRLYELYESVAEFLGDDVLYSSTVVSTIRRDDEGVSLKAHGADGRLTCIDAKRLLVAFEPTTESLAPFKTDEAEEEVFDKFGFATVYAGILRHPSLQPGAAYSNRSPAPGSTNYTVFPLASQVGSIAYIGGTRDLFQFTAVGTEEDTAESIKALIARSIDTMIDAGTVPASNGTVTFPAFANHGKMHPRVTGDELRAGFLRKQTALQGHRSTWYTGAAFSAGFSTVLWDYNNELLPRLVEGI